MVYIFGGGFAIGQIYDSAYDPSMLVSGASEDGHPVIYVGMNYRVGFFGFASSTELNATDSLNAGLLDQRLALEWVQQHISAFGGDPENVTIFGESVGATSVGFQMTAYGGEISKPLFQKAIMQSGAPTADIGTTSNSSTVHTSELAGLVNCTLATSAEELACLRSIPLSTLLPIVIEYQLSVNPFSGFDAFIPVAPSTFIPDSTSNLLASGRFVPNIDIMTGWNENDGSLFASTSLTSDSDVAHSLASEFPGLSEQSIQNALALYPASAFPNDLAINVTSQYFRASQMTRDYEFTCPSVLMVQANARKSGSTSNYFFVLNQTVFATMYAEEGASYWAVSHFSDIPYVFNQAATHYGKVSTASDLKLSAEMSSSWASFATYGNPSKGRGTLPDWLDAVTGSDGGNEYGVLVVGGPDDGMRNIGTSETDYENLATRCAFWNSPDILAQTGL
ncbi:Secreted lipase [Hyphodiscus hymeniophilus]|uniref:Secreted lipase n=1 Tax=Hyphodiscus hymeniophilus TaxID=353542 RepID=A0A9P7AUC7_9HELO|nr:Secreted lipase [Hyphodiscus hymeniophilus]